MEENTTGASRGRRRGATQQPAKTPPRAVGTPAEESGATVPDAGEASVATGTPAGATPDDDAAPGSEPLLVAERVTITSVTPLDAAGLPQAAEERVLMIRERAYLYAAGRGFEPGGEIDDWLRAEREIDAGL